MDGQRVKIIMRKQPASEYPKTNLRVGVEDGSRSTGHALPASTEEVIGGWLTLQVVSSGLGVNS